MSKVADAATDIGDGSWFKVSEAGYDVTTKIWPVQTLNANSGKRSFIVPSTLAPRNYLIRPEAIVLHSTGSVCGAQLYMSCFQINLSGTGTAEPASVTFPGAYSATDPGILINIYQDLTTDTTASVTSTSSVGNTTDTAASVMATSSGESTIAVPSSAGTASKCAKKVVLVE